MSRPVGVQQVGPLVARTGVMLALAPTSDPTLRMQVRSAVGSSTGTFTTFPDLAGQWGPGQRPTFTDVLPLDGVTRVYQTRAVRNDGTVVGAWSPSLKAKPGVLPEGGTIQMPVTGHKVGANVSLSTAIKLQYGSGNVPSSGSRSVFFGSAMWVPISTGVQYLRNGNGTITLSTSLVGAGSSAYQWQASLVLPAAATVRKLAFSYTRSGAGSVVAMRFGAVSTAGAVTTFWVSGNASTSGVVLSSSSFGAISNFAYILAELALKDATLVPVPPHFLYTRITYTVPSYDKTV